MDGWTVRTKEDRKTPSKMLEGIFLPSEDPGTAGLAEAVESGLAEWTQATEAFATQAAGLFSCTNEEEQDTSASSFWTDFI